MGDGVAKSTLSRAIMFTISEETYGLYKDAPV